MIRWHCGTYSGKRHQMDGSYEAAFDYLTRAAGLGVAAAHHMPCLVCITMVVGVLRRT